MLVAARCAQVVLFMNRHNASASLMQDFLDILHKCKHNPALLDEVRNLPVLSLTCASVHSPCPCAVTLAVS